MEQHLQNMAQKLIQVKNSDSFYANFAKHFTQEHIPQQFLEIMFFIILYEVNPIGSIKTWNKSSCRIYTKEIIENINNSRCRYSQIINTC